MGSVYGLIAMGLTLVFGTMRVINFAHGASFMVAMYMTFTIVTKLNINNYVAILFVVPIMFLYGMAMCKFFIQPVLDKEADARNPIGALVLTYGLSVVLENVFLWIFGANFQTITTTYSNIMVELPGDIKVALVRVVAFFIALVVTIIFYWFLQKSERGRIIRAVGQDRTAALLMGVNVKSTFRIAYGVSMAIVGVAAVAMIPFYSVYASMGNIFSIRALCTVLLGGLGSVSGAILGGLLIGVIEAVSTRWIPSTLSNMVVFYAFLLFLFIRPSGLFGSKHES